MAKILVVDDDPTIVDFLRVLLSRENHEVLTAANGKDGLAIAKQENPAAIVLDVMMPEMDGFTVSGILFQDPVMRLIPVLILTAKERPRDMFELVPNIRVYMTKPFEPSDLLNKLHALLPFNSRSR